MLVDEVIVVYVYCVIVCVYLIVVCKLAFEGFRDRKKNICEDTGKGLAVVCDHSLDIHAHAIHAAPVDSLETRHVHIGERIVGVGSGRIASSSCCCGGCI